MSNWSAALELGGLDIDSAFRDTVFAQLRESFGRMVRSPAPCVAADMDANSRRFAELLNVHGHASPTCVREARRRRQGAQEVSVEHTPPQTRHNDDCTSMGISLKIPC